jgi:hypothetical protein
MLARNKKRRGKVVVPSVVKVLTRVQKDILKLLRTGGYIKRIPRPYLPSFFYVYVSSSDKEENIDGRAVKTMVTRGLFKQRGGMSKKGALSLELSKLGKSYPLG